PRPWWWSRITASTEGSSRHSSSAAEIASHIAVVSACRALGRSSEMRPTAPSRRIRTSLVMVLPCRARWLPARAGAEVAVHPERWPPAPHRFSLDRASFSFVILNLFQDPFHRRRGVIGSGVVLTGRSLALAAGPRFSLWALRVRPH